MKNYETLIVEDRAPVLFVTFNRPEKANAMNNQMDKELSELVSAVGCDQNYRFIVFTGAGKVFSAGADIKEVKKNIEENAADPSWIRKDQINRQEFLRKFDALDQITIAAINGPAFGAGMALAMACDFRIMAEGAALSLPEVERGMFFSGGGTPRLVNLVGAARAKELIMLGDAISAQEAKDIGLVTKAVTAEELFSAVEEMLVKLQKKPFDPLRITKKIVNASVPRFENLLYYEAELQENMLQHGETLEQINDFVSQPTKAGRK
ncbi:enoyl-CoA hydratase/isomerase family protein [Planococcus shenhongbingii]|uniref:Enoyl-CoA hydratase/isomerase family protein n=1 Tax=Planococcus shenhongbingii TaxID=3058398 RepID=A0ABT8NAQ1_9BACL|nr:enoyl-CoA hydratase/isomerase family protein [Planococcus sp. N017]MDN7244625.1 enoyl-CoA hydratase/isomerase family protein [Planococcus sp. N017]